MVKLSRVILILVYLIQSKIRLMKKNLHAIIIGASGATGLSLVKLLIKDDRFLKISVFVRNEFKIQHEKISVLKIDFTNIKKYKSLIRGDVLFSALGTTRNEKGGKANQFLVDYSYQHEFARIACDNNVPILSLVSSVGANRNSFFFYPRLKGLLEDSIKVLNFKKIKIYQPSFLIRQNHLMRKNERIGIMIMKFFNNIGILKSIRPVSVSVLANNMINDIFKNSISIVNYSVLDLDFNLTDEI